MSHHYVLIDGNNIAFASQLHAMDKASRAKRLYAGEQETTAINGAVRAARDLQLRYPGARLLMLWDTGKAWRYGIYPDYKGNRKENPMLVEAKKALEPQRPLILPICDAMGIPQVTADNYEADDIAAFLADAMNKAGHRVTLVTRDQDWLQMVRPGVDWYDRFMDRTINDITFEADTGFKSAAEFSEAKVLKGDSGDNVPGVGGIGEVTAARLVEIFGTADAFFEGWEQWVADGNLIVGHPLRRMQKAIAKFLLDKDEAKAKIDLNRKLMDLRIMFGNDVLRKTIKKSSATIDPAALKKQLAQLAFFKIISDLDGFLQPFRRAA